MSTLSPLEIYRLNRQAGFDPLTAITATAIALAESGGRTTAIGDQNLNVSGEKSVGLFQINYVPTRDANSITRDPIANLDPLTNAKAAYIISNHGSNFAPWTTFGSGAYKKFLPNVTKAAASLDSSVIPDPADTPSPKPRIGRADAGQATQRGLDIAAENPLIPNGIWAGVEKFAFTTIFIIAGLGLLVLGVARLTGVEKIAKEAIDITKKIP